MAKSTASNPLTDLLPLLLRLPNDPAAVALLGLLYEPCPCGQTCQCVDVDNEPEYWTSDPDCAVCEGSGVMPPGTLVSRRWTEEAPDGAIGGVVETIDEFGRMERFASGDAFCVVLGWPHVSGGWQPTRNAATAAALVAWAKGRLGDET